jgi:hypothetical protein
MNPWSFFWQSYLLKVLDSFFALIVW